MLRYPSFLSQHFVPHSSSFVIRHCSPTLPVVLVSGVSCLPYFSSQWRELLIVGSVAFVGWQLELLSCIAMGHTGKGKGASALQGLLLPIHQRLDALDAAIRDVHPDYRARVLDRMVEIEECCRNHANKVFEIANNQKVALGTVVHKATQAQTQVEFAIERLASATSRHQEEAKALRSELGALKELVDEQSKRLEEERLQCESALDSFKELLANQAPLFEAWQADLVRRSQSSSANMGDILVEAQEVARSRDTSRSASRPREPRECPQSRGRSPLRSPQGSTPHQGQAGQGPCGHGVSWPLMQ